MRKTERSYQPGGAEPVPFVSTKQLLSVMTSQFSRVFLTSS